MARVISPGNERPGRTSRGATQHLIAAFSRAVQTASATSRFCAEWERKTSCGMEKTNQSGFTRALRNRQRNYAPREGQASIEWVYWKAGCATLPLRSNVEEYVPRTMTDRFR